MILNLQESEVNFIIMLITRWLDDFPIKEDTYANALKIKIQKQRKNTIGNPPNTHT